MKKTKNRHISDFTFDDRFAFAEASVIFLSREAALLDIYVYRE